jgi:hypothetical protein
MLYSAMLALAMDWADRQDNPTTGKFSTAWWLRQANYIKNVMARETGFYRKWHPMSVTANVREYDLPATYCWGIQELRYEGVEVTPTGIYELREDYPSRYDEGSSTPIEYIVKANQIELHPAPKRTCTSAGAILTTSAGGNFSNQPSNDALEVVSDSAADTTQTLTVWGTTFQTGTVVEEEIALNGTTVVTSSKTDWGDILGMELDAVCAGTVTIREASADQTVITITTGNTSKGVGTPTNTDGGKAYPLITASGTSTAIIGLYGTSADGTTLYDNCVALYGTAAITRTLPKRMDTITKVLLGALASSQTVSVTRGAALELFGGSLPSDLTTGTDSITGLPPDFGEVVAHGMAAMAELSDIYEQQQQQRANAHQQAFWQGVGALNAKLNFSQMEREHAFGRDQSLYLQLYQGM